MPIFTKDGQRIYFAHIPKTAGSALYLTFLANGWSIANVDTGLGPKRIGRRIYDEFGIKDIPRQGEKGDFPFPMQHATADIWTRWGPFDGSFAVIRNPLARFNSAIRYEFYTRRPKLELQDYAQQLFDRVRANAHDPLGGRIPVGFLPQSDYVTPETVRFHFEDGFAEKIAVHFGFERPDTPFVNKNRYQDLTLTQDMIDWVKTHYAGDYAMFGYDAA